MTIYHEPHEAARTVGPEAVSEVQRRELYERRATYDRGIEVYHFLAITFSEYRDPLTQNRRNVILVFQNDCFVHLDHGFVRRASLSYAYYGRGALALFCRLRVFA